MKCNIIRAELLNMNLEVICGIDERNKKEESKFISGSVKRKEERDIPLLCFVVLSLKKQ